MTPGEVLADDESKRVVAAILFEAGRDSEIDAGAITVASVKDAALAVENQHGA